jgi:PhnB protein
MLDHDRQPHLMRTMDEHEQQPPAIPEPVHGQLGYLQIPAVDITTSARFYERVFGWRVAPPEAGFEAPGLIGQWVTDRPSAPDTGPVGWIQVDDVRRTLQEADRAGATLRDRPIVDGPRLLASFSDPAGNLVGIVQHEADTANDASPRTRGRHPVISVMLIVPDAERAVGWYRDALGAAVLWDLGGVAGLEIDGAPFFIHEVNPDNPAEGSPDRLGVTSTRIEVFVDDPDGFMEHAISAGATARSGIVDHEMPWGTHRQGGFRDPFGHSWSVGDRSPLSLSSR